MKQEEDSMPRQDEEEEDEGGLQMLDGNGGSQKRVAVAAKGSKRQRKGRKGCERGLEITLP